MDSLAGRQADKETDVLTSSLCIISSHLVSCHFETYLVTAMCVLETAVPQRTAQQDSTTLSSYAHSRSS